LQKLELSIHLFPHPKKLFSRSFDNHQTILRLKLL